MKKNAIKLLSILVILIVIISCKKKLIETTPVVYISAINSPTTENISDIAITDNKTVYITDYFALYKTEDMGVSWQKNTDMARGKKIIFTSNDTGFIYNGGFYRTVDGENWNKIDFTGTFVDFDFKNNIGYALTIPSNNTYSVYKTVNSGANWSLVFSNYLNGDLSKLSMANDSSVICLGDGATISTANGGVDWEIINSGPLYITDVYYTSIKDYKNNTGKNVGYQLAHEIEFINISEEYNSWKFDLKSIDFYNSSGVMVGEKIVLKRNGNEWIYHYNQDGTTIPYTFTKFDFINENTILAVGDSIIKKIEF